MTEGKFERLSDKPDSVNDEIISASGEHHRPTIYYPYCQTEKVRIGSDTVSLQTAKLQASHHETTHKGHAAVVKLK